MKPLIAWAILIASLPLASAETNDEIASRGPLQISLRRAIEIATSPEGNNRIQIQLEDVKQAKARSSEALSGLLPDVESYVQMGSSVRSLSAQGLTYVKLPFNVQIPSRVGPYHTLDIRGTGQQVLFDYSIWKRYSASRAGVRAAKASTSDADDQITAQVAKAYIAALRTDASLEAAQADADLAGAEVKQAEHQKEAGSGTGLDITRSRVQLADDQQRVLVAKNNQTRAHLQLLRVMNLRLDTPIQLTDKLTYKPVDTLTVEDAIAQALATRSDLKAQLEKEDSTRLNASSVKYERLPTVGAQFDYGTVGPQDITLLPTRDFVGTVRIPIFDGGRRDARRVEAFSQLRQERTRTHDLRDQIELDVRTALDSLKSADDQVKVAEEGLHLAESELKQARRRYEAGVASGIEVTDASDRVARARSNEIDALYNHNSARVDLGAALGKTLSMIQ